MEHAFTKAKTTPRNLVEYRGQCCDDRRYTVKRSATKLKLPCTNTSKCLCKMSKSGR
ncbi:hypothetical protein WN55_04807 [Dufourea novaeangliae]|uniref:Uncharacterized protein n=1 Tax=Dufourea novaeangliae TaxID=178035 RepID=A0A154PLK7_DUFNO|nr:hypothetical protein WN55_04807 [Dufourea novaeangliae]